MHRIDGPGHKNHRFYRPDPEAIDDNRGTLLTAEWLNALQEELAAVIEGAGLPLAKQQNGQLSVAVSKIASDKAALVETACIQRKLEADKTLEAIQASLRKKEQAITGLTKNLTEQTNQVAAHDEIIEKYGKRLDELEKKVHTIDQSDLVLIAKVLLHVIDEFNIAYGSKGPDWIDGVSETLKRMKGATAL